MSPKRNVPKTGSSEGKVAASSSKNANNEDVGSSNVLDEALQDQFELELCWCIQQLESGLHKVKLQEKQKQNVNKYVHALKSNKVPPIKKRQIMRATFGDYRAKMAEEEKRLSTNASIVKFSKPAKQNKESLFLRKAVIHESTPAEVKTMFNTPSLGSSFKFNFQPPVL
ncbi:UPF0488 protein CG14286 [Orussus abietinus]|uniref:UPF0488 protein CG14286 n=1 Tax=Orussus abietinus TaxID=222816 RepID=UPI000625AB43|nr:UPF0488 protein CG14286 [Orussus abietinus]